MFPVLSIPINSYHPPHALNNGQTADTEAGSTMSILRRDADVDHYDVFTTAIGNLLRTKIAEHTFAEIIDGIPTAQTWYESIPKRHIEAHRELCLGSLEAAQRSRADVRPENLTLDASICIQVILLPASPADYLVLIEELRAFRDSPPGSQTF